MAVTVTDFSIPTPYKVIHDTDVSNTAVENATGAAGTLHAIEVSHGNYTGYLKIYDTTACVTGTTVPTIILFVPGNADFTLHIPEGYAFTNGISYAFTQTAGVAGTTYGDNGSNAVIMRIVTT
tara:strand:+ start:1930 stop:2298 length:369 start_codon:yes stop_codon:yes gene_type:complete